MLKETFRFLIVDDDEVDRMTLQRALRKGGFQFDWKEATNAQSALAVIEQETFDCAFIDYYLPDQDGLSLLKTLRARGMRVPILVLTGQSDEQVAVELMKAGASDYLNKTRISPAQISQMVLRSLRLYRAEERAISIQEQLRESNALLRIQNVELERQKRQIQVQNLQLIEAARLKSEFIATVSHELRTPMNAIIGFSQVLARQSQGALSGYQLNMVNRILSNGEHLLALITDLLDFSKIEAGRMQLVPQTFDLSEVVHETLEELRSLARTKALTLTLETNLTDLQLTNDPLRIKQILINLISNAIKFTEQGSILVGVSTSLTEADSIQIEVRDTGIGIAPEQLDHIFEAFRQLDQSVRRHRPGTGLGLAITRALVEMMDGTITVESVLGKGSTFRICIPRHIKSQAAD